MNAMIHCGVNNLSIQRAIKRYRKILELFSLNLYFKAVKNKELLANKHFKSWLTTPMNYWRCLELPIALYMLNPRSTDKILDIGSPKLLSLFLASKIGSTVYSTDLLDYFIDDSNQFCEIFQLSNLISETCDACAMPYGDCTFDKVFSISTSEHIPRDMAAISEINRVLKPGGECVITVPYHYNGLVEYTKANHYWIDKSDKPAFYQRRYSYLDLQHRIVQSSRIMNLYLIAEKTIKPPYISKDGTYIHNYFFLDRSIPIKIARRFRLPYVTYLVYRWYSNRLHYISNEPKDQNVRNVALRLKKTS